MSTLPGTLLGGSVVFGGCRTHNGRLSRRIADADEDPVTLTLDVVRAFLDDTGQDADTIGSLSIVGCLTDEDATVIAEALGQPELPVSVHAATPEAAMDALVAAASRSGGRPCFVVAVSDGRTTASTVDPTRGAAAALLVVGTGGKVRFEATAHVRRHRDEPGARTALSRAVLELLEGHDPEQDLVALSAHSSATLKQVFGRAPGVTVATAPVEAIGDVGCAAPYLGLAHALAVRDPEQSIALVAVAETGATAIRIMGGGVESRLDLQAMYQAPAREVDAQAALSLATAWLADRDAKAQGAFISRQQYLQQAPARYRLQGQRCSGCAQAVFPPRECCPACGSDAMEPTRFEGGGVVYARTGIGTGGAPTEFVPLQRAAGSYAVAIIELDEGPRVAAMLTGPGAAEARIGTPVQMVTRLSYWQDGRPRYGFKAYVGPHSS